MHSRYRGIMIMGVSCSGKTLVGRMFAERMGWEFIDADDFHSPENKAKIAHAIPLDEDDRMDEWIPELANEFGGRVLRDEPAVLAYSGLKRRYRDAIPLDWHVGRFLLHVTPGVADQRARERPGHFAKADFVRTQFRDIEWPEADERIVILDSNLTPEMLVHSIWLNSVARYPMREAVEQDRSAADGRQPPG